jgi:hypothetical protein
MLSGISYNSNIGNELQAMLGDSKLHPGFRSTLSFGGSGGREKIMYIDFSIRLRSGYFRPKSGANIENLTLSLVKNGHICHIFSQFPPMLYYFFPKNH